MHRIDSLHARAIRDSRGEPTIEVEIFVGGKTAIASVPSGASVGAHEAVDLRDGGSDEGGRGVSHALQNIETTIVERLVGAEFDQQSLDAALCELDGTPNKSHMGANATLGVSIAFARGSALASGVPLYRSLASVSGSNAPMLPEPLFNVLNGGKHARHGIDIQECMLAPTGIKGMREKVQAVSACIAILKSRLMVLGYDTPMGDEGGFAPSLSSNDEALDLLRYAIVEAGYDGRIQIALDVAASSFYKDGSYVLASGGVRTLSHDELVAWYARLAETYPLISIEDGCAEDDWDGFTALTATLGEKVRIVGDDLTVTNVDRIRTCIEKKACTACIIKPNQVGTVSEAIAAIGEARGAGWRIFASHRSGETLDTFIADFATGLSCDYLKAGAPTRPERVVKYNRLMEIESELGL